MPDPKTDDLTRALRGMDFPCGKRDLLHHAEARKAAATVVAALEALPDHQYNGMAEVMRALGAVPP